MAAMATFASRVGTAVKNASAGSGAGWFGPHMAAASCAILDRIPFVDFTVEIRDARIPLSSAYKYPTCIPSASRRIIVLNKMDLADRSQTQKWIKYFEEQNLCCYGINSHNKDNIKEVICNVLNEAHGMASKGTSHLIEFLKFLQGRIRQVKMGNSNYTATVMLVGIPNVGKSATANSLHQIGRISAAEKGKLKHASVTSFPGETKDISSYKIASHPNVYVLDTPGVLPPQIIDVELASKLVLTGAVKDDLVGEMELAQYFLAILNSNDGYKQWEKLISTEVDKLFKDQNESCCDKPRKRQYATDHTQDFIVRDVRRTLFETLSSFNGNLENEKNMVGLIEMQFMALHEAFRIPTESGDGLKRVATKLLNLYRTGRLGHYTLDPLPNLLQTQLSNKLLQPICI